MATALSSDRPAPSAPPGGSFLRVLFVTLGYIETDFYVRVGLELSRRGHAVAHLTASRRAAIGIRRGGGTAWCLPDLIAQRPAAGDLDAAAEAARVRYGLPTFREVYRTDVAFEHRPEPECLADALRMLEATEQVFETWGPTIVVPEVGNETIRTAAHLVGLRRGIPVLFLLYTIFDAPLRLYVDRLVGHIVDSDELGAPTESDRRRVAEFVASFTARRVPIRQARGGPVLPLLRPFLRHLIVKALWDRENPWLRPGPWLRRQAAEHVRSLAARRIYVERPPNEPFVYFPLHVVEDYKIKKLLPHCYDQGALIELVANALPHGMRLVTKEHPLGIGRTPLSLLRRISRLPNATVLPPSANSHDLIAGARAVVTIGSTVGLEALLYGKPVLTLGDPFYAGAGVTIDVDSFAEVPEALARALHYTPDPDRVIAFLATAMRRCLPGRPVLVDGSDANAAVLADSLEVTASALAVR
jgi:hypothetical protein